MKIKIKNLTFNCIIGILPFERKQKQRVIINCSFRYFFKDDKFIDYSLVANDIEKIMKKKKFKLIEDALLYIEKKLKSKYKLKNLKLNIAKPDILSNCEVMVAL